MEKYFLVSLPKILLSVSAGVVLSTSGCVPLGAKDPLLESLAGKGFVQVTPSNPFVAPVQFLTREMQRSKELSGFIELKGYPTAMELTSSAFGGVMLSFLYQGDERYELTSNGGDSPWIITGPFRGFPSPPVTAEAASPGVVATETKTPGSPKTPIPVLRVTPVVTPALRVTVAIPHSEVTPLPTAPADARSAGFSSPSRESPPPPSPSTDTAELTPRGDLVHYVTMHGETLSILARWYTQDRTNAPKLSRLNRLKNPDVLTLGDTIVIPSYMVRNKVRLTEAELSRLRDEVAQGKLR